MPYLNLRRTLYNRGNNQDTWSTHIFHKTFLYSSYLLSALYTFSYHNRVSLCQPGLHLSACPSSGPVNKHWPGQIVLALGRVVLFPNLLVALGASGRGTSSWCFPVPSARWRNFVGLDIEWTDVDESLRLLGRAHTTSHILLLWRHTVLSSPGISPPGHCGILSSIGGASYTLRWDFILAHFRSPRGINKPVVRVWNIHRRSNGSAHFGSPGKFNFFRDKINRGRIASLRGRGRFATSHILLLWRHTVLSSPGISPPGHCGILSSIGGASYTLRWDFILAHFRSPRGINKPVVRVWNIHRRSNGSAHFGSPGKFNFFRDKINRGRIASLRGRGRFASSRTYIVLRFYFFEIFRTRRASPWTEKILRLGASPHPSRHGIQISSVLTVRWPAPKFRYALTSPKFRFFF